MTGPAVHDDRMTVRAGMGPAAGAILVLALAAGCSASPGGGGTGAAGTGTGTTASPAGSSGAPGPAGSGSPAANGPAGPGASGSVTQAGCSAWPAGSSRSVLSVTAGSDGQTYCVRTGQTVQVLLSGRLALADGAQPPRLAGDALAAGPVRQAQMTKMPAQTYTAVRPGTAVLTIVRLPCHSPQSVPGPGASGASLLSLTTGRGGVPVGTNCGAQQVLRVFIVVT
jgi:hypothetical protein